MSTLRLLDLYCKAGGVARGYQLAGFEVVGVDIEPQPRYPFEFIQADALEVLAAPELVAGIDAIHASPPCQSFTVYRNCRPGAPPRWPDLIDQTRLALSRTGLPWVIENVPGAPLRGPVRLCGTSFGLPVRRHRLFEANFALLVPPCAHGRFVERRFPGGTTRPNGRTVCPVGDYRYPLALQRECMGIDWPMTLHELAEAIPPAYTELVGAQLLATAVAWHGGSRGPDLQACNLASSSPVRGPTTSSQLVGTSKALPADIGGNTPVALEDHPRAARARGSAFGAPMSTEGAQ